MTPATSVHLDISVRCPWSTTRNDQLSVGWQGALETFFCIKEILHQFKRYMGSEYTYIICIYIIYICLCVYTVYHFNMTRCGINLKFRACSSWEKPLHWVDSPSKLFGWHHSWPQILARIDAERQASGDMDLGRNDTWDVQKQRGSQQIQDINRSRLRDKMDIIYIVWNYCKQK